MTTSRWDQLQALFNDALDRAPEDRAAFLDAACDDPDLRREVRELLVSHEHDGPLDLLGEDWTPTPGTFPMPPTSEGRRIGPYRVVRRLGSGGMGDVYLAERADGQFERRVALKLLRDGLESDAMRTRFLNERQTLARLEHPGIARLIDGGLSEGAGGVAGRPYFAMEVVEGERIDRYCDGRQLDVGQRLRLFGQVCEAVHHAHQRLVIHRDLKPSNILVTDEGEPHVKLLDFGIAKLIENAAPGEQTQTRLLTPEYAAPEQIAGGEISTATDVYSLGVVLYELLTGRRPVELADLAPGEVVQAVCETDPPAPSTVVGRATGGETPTSPATLSQDRGAEPDTLARRLRGDLDTICLKALDRQPERRYASAEAFLDDVKRHLDGLPVRARPASAGYRARKFVSRHRTGVLAAALVGLAILGGLGAALWQADRAATQAEIAEAERDRARTETEKADATVGFLTSLLLEAGPESAQGDTLTVFDALERGEARVEEDLADQPEVQAEVYETLGTVYRDMGQFDRATPLFARALALRREHTPADTVGIADSLLKLGTVAFYRGDAATADALWNDALGLLRTVRPSPEETAAALNNLAGLRLRQGGDPDSSIAMIREAIAVRQRLPESSQVDLATNVSTLAFLLKRTEDYPAADSASREAIALFEAHLDNSEGHPALANEWNNRGTLLVEMGELEEAESALRRALATFRRVHPDGHPQLASTLNNLGSTVERQGRVPEAEGLYREAVEIHRTFLGDEHASTANSLGNLALALRRQDKWIEAEEVMNRALAARRAAHGADHPRTWLASSTLADLRCERGATGPARRALQQSLDGLERAFPGGHPWVWRTRAKLGVCLVRAGEMAQAEPLLASAYQGLDGEPGEDRERAARALIQVYESTNRPRRAATYRGALATLVSE